MFRAICQVTIAAQLLTSTIGFAGALNCPYGQVGARPATTSRPPVRDLVVRHVVLPVVAMLGFLGPVKADIVTGIDLPQAPTVPVFAPAPILPPLYDPILGWQGGGTPSLASDPGLLRIGPLGPPSPWDNCLGWGFGVTSGSERPLRITLDVDKLNKPKDTMVTQGPQGTYNGKHYAVPEPDVLGGNRGLGVRITSKDGKSVTEIREADQGGGLRWRQEAGDAELFLAWAGKPTKPEATAAAAPAGHEGLKDVDLTTGGGDRFLVRHSGGPGKAEVRVYDAKNPENYLIGTVTFAAGSAPGDHYLPFTDLKPAATNTGPVDIKNVAGVSIKYKQDTAVANVLIPPPPCSLPCTPGTIVQIPIPKDSVIHYVGVVGPDSVGGGGLGGGVIGGGSGFGSPGLPPGLMMPPLGTSGGGLFPPFGGGPPGLPWGPHDHHHMFPPHGGNGGNNAGNNGSLNGGLNNGGWASNNGGGNNGYGNNNNGQSNGGTDTGVNAVPAPGGLMLAATAAVPAGLYWLNKRRRREGEAKAQ